MKDDQANLPSERQVWVASIISALAHAVENNHPWSVYPSEAVALFAEIERLRAEAELGRTEAATMRSWAEEAAATENENAEDARRERAAVAAFLRETLATSETAYASDDLDYAIDIIERGEHRRGETE